MFPLRKSDIILRRILQVSLHSPLLGCAKCLSHSLTNPNPIFSNDIQKIWLSLARSRNGKLHDVHRSVFMQAIRTLHTSDFRLQKPDGSKDDKSGKDDNIFTTLLKASLYLLGAYMTIVLLSLLFPSGSKDDQGLRFISWSEFYHQMLAKGEVKEIIVRPEMGIATVVLHENAVFNGKPATFRFYHIEIDTKKFETQLRQAEEKLGIPPTKGVVLVYERNYSSAWLLLGLMITFALLTVYMFRKGNSNMQINIGNMDLFSFRRAKFRLVDPMFQSHSPKVKFSDVAGLHEAKIEIREFIDYLKRPETYMRLGAKLPKGALLLGPPGCGKTLLAKAVATEANVPFLAVNGTEFIEMIGGLGAARVRDLFKEAKRRAPCIVYIDEIDALGRRRSGGSGNFGGASTSEEEQTLNQLLVELDGMDTAQGVIVIASTNRADILDKALLRRGRFDRHINIDIPTRLERRELFDYYLKKIKLQESFNKYSTRMADMTPSFSGADIMNICNEAAIHAATNGKNVVMTDDLDYALERVIAGSQKKSQTLSPEEKEVVAYHESGHALIGWLLKYTDALLKLSILPRTSAALGFTQYNPQDRKLFSKEELFERMCMALGGRAAENVTFGRISTSAQDDLKKVTRIAYDQVKVYGMNDAVGPLSFRPSPGDEQAAEFMKKPYSKKLQGLIDQEARQLINNAYGEAERILTENKSKLEILAKELLKKEVLNYDDVVKLIGPPLFKENKRTIEDPESVLPDPLGEFEEERPEAPPPKRQESED